MRNKRQLSTATTLLGLLLAGLVACGPDSEPGPEPLDEPVPCAPADTEALECEPETSGDWTPSEDVPETPDTHTLVPVPPEPTDPGPGDDPNSDTDKCAFAGDPLCPDTPITIPPPNLDNYDWA